jgi:NTP pyrophosphatase (non-canonical NTP hydrolase)
MKELIAKEILAEVARQDLLKAQGKFSETAEDMMRRGATHAALTVLTEEVGEVARALNDNEPCVDLRQELIQVAAVCISAIAGLEYAMVAASSAI